MLDELEKFLILNKHLLDIIYNNIYGSNDNVIEYKIKKHNTKYYLIRTKILKDITDNCIYFEELSVLIEHILHLPKPSLNYISISFCMDNIYILNTYVAIISILSNKNDNTFISFYLITSKDFEKDNKDIILSLYEQYEFFNISFIKMDNRFDNVKTFRYITKTAYFKLTLAELLPQLNKIIYLDSDIIVYKDLYNLFNLNFNNNLFLASGIYGVYKYKNKSLSFNTGVLLLNLKRMREFNFTKKIENILSNGFKDTKYFLHDQAIINQFFFDYIGYLEPGFNSRNSLLKYNSEYYIGKKDYKSYFNLIHSEKHPYIYHFTGDNKPIRHKRKNSDDWWYYARKGKYWPKILKNIKY